MSPEAEAQAERDAAFLIRAQFLSWLEEDERKGDITHFCAGFAVCFAISFPQAHAWGYKCTAALRGLLATASPRSVAIRNGVTEMVAPTVPSLTLPPRFAGEGIVASCRPPS